MAMQVLYLVLAIGLLFVGAEFSLTSAEKIGKSIGLPSLVIGLLIIGFGTSLPEFFVSQLAAHHGDGALAMGNIVGSNIANLLLILGVSSLIVPIPLYGRGINKQLILHLVLTSILSIILLQDGLYWWAAVLLVSFFFFYLTESFREMKRSKTHKASAEERADDDSLHILIYLKLVAGFSLLYFGGELLVDAGGSLAKFLGVSSYVISAILVAFGTSFPELVTAILACVRKKDTGLIIGNIIGSNIFNVAFVMGSIVPHGVGFDRTFYSEIIVLMVIALFLLFLSFMKKNFNWMGGVVFLLSYGVIIYSWL